LGVFNVLATLLSQDRQFELYGTNESLNLGFAYMPEELTSSVALPTNITDNRTDNVTIPYEMASVKVTLGLSTTVYVYSYKNKYQDLRLATDLC